MASKIELTPSSYALKANAKEATELHYGCPVEGKWLCLCGVCQRQIEEDEEMWFVSETNEILCEECFEEYIDNKHPNALHKIHSPKR